MPVMETQSGAGQSKITIKNDRKDGKTGLLPTLYEHIIRTNGQLQKNRGVASITCEKPPGTAMNAGRNLV
jgi:hypothetical protein